MKIVLFSDIHANLPAFEKALNLIDQLQPDAIYCLGDLVGYHVWPNEVINEIRKRGIPTIAGNHDAKVKKLSDAQLAEPGKNYAYSLIGTDEKKYLATLPAHIRVEYQLNNDLLTLLGVHGSPDSNDEYLLQDKDETAFLEVFRKSNANILCFGHSHKPYHRVLTDQAEGQTRYKHAINIGSIGKPKDGTPNGCFAVITITENTSVNDADSLQVELIHFEYDVEKAAKAIEDSPLSNEFADMLRKGY
ncbi:metallophosphoesterase family protein [Paraflavitalea pollutisoli]|uniref:metallophosphoesterase family protein n=1 Tax=Paraflavitalea pollutisoli TaxID=3034143 RepID=UPI0023EB9CE4|nr:metallophosphoesterase family protein [Paraflavitalea sp. H1-2-19X]